MDSLSRATARTCAGPLPPSSRDEANELGGHASARRPLGIAQKALELARVRAGARAGNAACEIWCIRPEDLDLSGRRRGPAGSGPIAWGRACRRWHRAAEDELVQRLDRAAQGRHALRTVAASCRVELVDQLARSAAGRSATASPIPTKLSSRPLAGKLQKIPCARGRLPPREPAPARQPRGRDSGPVVLPARCRRPRP